MESSSNALSRLMTTLHLEHPSLPIHQCPQPCVHVYPIIESPISGVGGPADTATESPHINALPTELFLDILLQTPDFKRALITQLHNLAQVCTYWSQSILSDSRFWCVIDLHQQHLAAAVLRRNPSGPLTVQCCDMKLKSPADGFIKVARIQAHRWERLEISGEIRDSDLQLFDVPTPALVTFHVTSSRDRWHPIFPLSSSSTLRHVAVSGIQLPWESANFSGLRSLSIRTSTPSLRQIVTALSAAPALEWFSLREIPLYGYPVDDTDVPEQTISLPALRGLYLQRIILLSITQHLLKTINGPQCRYLEAPITFQLLQHPGPTLRKLVSIPIRAADAVRMNYANGFVTVDIRSLTLPDNHHHNGWQSESDDAGVSISIDKIPYPSTNALESVIDVLPFNIDHVDVKLGMQRSTPDVKPAGVFGNHPAIWNSATHIHWGLGYRPQCIIANLKFLASPIVDDGQGGWPCSRLVSISLAGSMGEEAEEVAHATLKFLEKRSGARIGGVGSTTEAGIAWDIPVPLEVLKAKECFLGLIRGLKLRKACGFLSMMVVLR